MLGYEAVEKMTLRETAVQRTSVDGKTGVKAK